MFTIQSGWRRPHDTGQPWFCIRMTVGDLTDKPDCGRHSCSIYQTHGSLRPPMLWWWFRIWSILLAAILMGVIHWHPAHEPGLSPPRWCLPTTLPTAGGKHCVQKDPSVLSPRPLKPSGHYMYRQFNIQQFYVLPHTAVFMCFVWISEQIAIISLYNINWLVCVTETVCVYCAVRTGSDQ